MRIAVSALIALHALIHVMGFAKAFGLAAVALLFAAPRWFWLVGLIGMVVSQIAIVASGSDARFGTI